jgi:ubiquinol-cytochrome c reductase cytochrome b subunit
MSLINNNSNSNLRTITRIRGDKRIGPHIDKVISIIYGTLLGDSHLEKRVQNVRISFQQENSNVEYLFWLWKTLSLYGYCSNNEPKKLTRLGKGGKIRYYYKFHTWTYSSLNYLYDEWYQGGLYKRVPKNIEKNLTPLALACWIMDDGSKCNNALKLSTNAFLFEDIKILSEALLSRYDIKSAIHKSGVENQWVLYVRVESMPKLREIVKDHMVESMNYKLGIY